MKIRIIISLIISFWLFCEHGSAQCQFTVEHIIKNATCGNNGVIEARINYPMGSSASNFSGFTYHLEKSSAPGQPITSINNVDPYIGNLNEGTYNLIVKGLCNIGTPTTVTQTITNIVIGKESPGAFTVAYIGTGYKSLPDYSTGELKFEIKGNNVSSTMTVDVVKYPVAYDGPKHFIITSGEVTIGKLKGSTNEGYQFRFSDGCRTVTAGMYYVDILPSNFPTSELTYALTSTAYCNNYTDNACKPWPTGDLNNVMLTMKIFGNKPQIGIYNSEYSDDWYECGYNLNTNDPNTAIWTTFPLEFHIIPAKLTYKEYIDNGYGSALGTPYTWIRIKENPNDYLYHQTTVHVGSASFTNNYTMYYAQYKDKGRLSLFFLSSGSEVANSDWYYTPFVFTAKKGNSVYEFIYNDGDNINPTLEIPWSDGGTYDLTVTMGQGSNQHSIDLGTFNFTPHGYMGIATDITYNHAPCVGWEKIRISSSNHSSFNILGYLSRGTFYETKGWEYVSTEYPASSPWIPIPKIIQEEYAGSSRNTTFYLTSNTADGKENSTKEVAVGHYGWTATPTPLDGGSFTVTPTTHTDRARVASVPLIPVIQTPYETNINVELVSKECQKATFRFKKDDVYTRFKKEDGTPYPYVIVQAIYYEGQSLWRSYDFPAKLSFTNGFIGSSNRPAVALNEISDEYVYFTVQDVWPYRINDAQCPVHLFATAATKNEYNIYSFGITSLNNNGCYWRSSNSITVNLSDLLSVELDEDLSGGYRCTSIGGGIIEIVTTTTGNFDIELWDKDNTTLLNTKTITNGNKCSFTGLPDTDYVVRTYVLDSSNNRCIAGGEIREIHIENLDNPRLAGYEGGVDCADGQVNDLILKATSIIRTTYRWYDPAGNPITTATKGAKTYPDGNDVYDDESYDYRSIIIPGENIIDGQYTCLVTTNPECGTVEAKTPFVSLSGGISLYWRVDAIDDDWNNDENWNDVLGFTAYQIPDKCTDVYIPGKSTFYPNLDPIKTGGDAMCRDIIFAFGAQTYFTNYLNYDRAFVEYNFGYYGEGVVPEDEDTPNFNADEYNNPSGTYTGGKTLTRSRWWMLATPLKEMVTGDFNLMGKPFVSTAFLDYKTDTYNRFVFNLKNGTQDNIFSVIANNDIRLNDHYNALMLWMPKYSGATGATQEVLENSALKGRIRYPYFDNDEIKSARRISHLGNITTFTTHNFANPANLMDTENITRNYFDQTKKLYQANRFVYEEMDGGVERNSSGEPVYRLTIKADSNRSGGNVMIGNPFMAPLDFNKFHTNNATKIKSHFLIYDGNSWQKTEKTDADAVIAPQQAFIIELVNPTMDTELEFLIGDVLKHDTDIRIKSKK